jgi:hypothetical protein
MYIDESVYPDVSSPPNDLPSLEARAEYVHRVCSAWDFHIHPEPETFQLFSEWEEVFDRFPLPTSPAYHAFRAWFGWEPVPFPSSLPAPIPYHVHLDRGEGRDDDPCAEMI